MFMFLPLPAIYKCFFFPSKSNLYFVFAGTHFRAHRHCQTSQTPIISCGLWRTTTQSLEHPQERVQDIPACTVRLAAQVQSFQRTSKHTNGPEIRRWCEAVVAVVKTKMGSTNEAPVSLFSQAVWLIPIISFEILFITNSRWRVTCIDTLKSQIISGKTSWFQYQILPTEL